MYCQTCGKQLRDDAEFCVHCGSPIKKRSIPKQAVECPLAEPTAPTVNPPAPTVTQSEPQRIPPAAPAPKPEPKPVTQSKPQRIPPAAPAPKPEPKPVPSAPKPATFNARLNRAIEFRTREQKAFGIISLVSKLLLLLVVLAAFLPYCRIVYSAARSIGMPFMKLAFGGEFTLSGTNAPSFTLVGHPEMLILLLLPLPVLLPLLLRRRKGEHPFTYGLLIADGLTVIIWNAAVLSAIRSTVEKLSLSTFERHVVSVNAVMIRWIQAVLRGEYKFENTFHVSGAFGKFLIGLFGWAILAMGVVGLVLYFRSLPARKADPAPEGKEPPQGAEPTEDTEDDDVPVFTGDML